MTFVGEAAFNGVQNVSATAGSRAVAASVLECGAENITLNIGAVKDDLSGMTFAVSDQVNQFVLQGQGKTYSSIKVKSDASATTINGVTFADCTGIPVQVSSGTLNLQFVTIDSPSYAILMTADMTNVVLYGNTYVSTAGDKAMVCNDMSVTIDPEAVSNGVSSKLKVWGDILTCSSAPDQSNVTFESGKFVQITPEEFAKEAVYMGCFHLPSSDFEAGREYFMSLCTDKDGFLFANFCEDATNTNPKQIYLTMEV